MLNIIGAILGGGLSFTTMILIFVVPTCVVLGGMERSRYMELSTDTKECFTEWSFLVGAFLGVVSFFCTSIWLLYN